MASKLEDLVINDKRVSGDGADDNEEDNDVVNPWDVAAKSETGVDYDKLISKFCLIYLVCHA